MVTGAEGAKPRVSVCFPAVGEEAFLLYSDNTFEKVRQQVRRVIYCDSIKYNGRIENPDKTIKDYFTDVNNYGAYLIAEMYTDLVAKEECDQGKILGILDGGVDWKPSEYGYATLYTYDVDGDESSYKIYDFDKNEINIHNPENLTLQERECILSCRTDNPTLYTFAAEVLYHAEYSDNPMYKGNCIKADLSVAEDAHKDFSHNWATMQFKDPASSYVLDQAKRWKPILEP